MSLSGATSAELTGSDDGRVPRRQRASGARAWLVTGAKTAITLAILAAVAFAIKSQWTQVRTTLYELNWIAVAVSGVLVLLGMGAAVRAWQHVLAELGKPIPAVSAGRFYLVGQLGKYLPGSVWAFVLQMELARRAGVPRATGFVAVLVTVGLSVTSALVVGMLGLPAVFSYSPLVAWIVIGLVPVAVACASPPVLNRIINLVLRLLRREPLQQVLTLRGIAPAILWCAVSWVFYGAHLWMLANSFAVSGGRGLIECIGAISLGMTAGVLAVVAPSGIGVREAVIVAALAPYMDSGKALGLALASRLVFTVSEVLAGAVAAVSGAREMRRARRAGQPA